MKKCPHCKALVDSLLPATEYESRECGACRRGVYETANDVICRTPEEFEYWIKRLRGAGRESDAVILEAQQLAAVLNENGRIS